jgi:hypothetical protein
LSEEFLSEGKRRNSEGTAKGDRSDFQGFKDLQSSGLSEEFLSEGKRRDSEGTAKGDRSDFQTFKVQE